jgi:3-mercaptopyruvate sulfurtransferase SseA
MRRRWKACSSARGIDPRSTLVCYGYAPALAFWLMKLYRHADVRVLDCSRRAWMDDERPWTTDAPTPNPTTRYPLAAPNAGIRADYATVRAAIGRRSTAMVDVRGLAEFPGERFWPSGAPEPSGRAGHVPSAIHLPIDNVTTTEADSVPSMNSASSSRRSPHRRSATSSPTAPSAAEPPPPGSC